MAAVLFFVLHYRLVPALVAGLAVHALIQALGPRLVGAGLSRGRARVVAVALLAAVVVCMLGGLCLLLVAFYRGKIGHLPNLMDRMAAVVEQTREQLGAYLPLPETDDLHSRLAAGIRQHARELKDVGVELGVTVMHILVGLVIGALVSFDMRRPEGPLLRALGGRLRRLERTFARIISAQLKISGLNTVLTALFLLGALPLCGVALPFRKTLICISFLGGLIPIAGNLISNSIIVIISLGSSLGVAAASLTFLVVVHKLEYFVNARIVGSEIHAAAWEMLLAIFVLEAAFGIQGVIAAPIYYAYLKTELSDRGLLR